jgi:tetratricopeptide (TPR) repeat protein
MLSLLSKKTEFLFHQIIGYGHYFGSRLLEKSKNDFERVRLLDEKLKILSQKQKMELLRVLAILYTDLGDGDMAIKYADEGLLNCENNSFEKAELLSQKGYAQSLFNKFEESEAIFKEGLLILESLPKSNQNDFLKSIIYGQRAINIAQTLLCDDKDALSYIKEAFSSFDFDGQIRKGIPRQVCYHFATLGHIYCYRGEFEEAMSEGFLKAMSIIDNQWDGCPHHIIKLFTQGGIGECLLRFGKVTEAEKLLRDVVDRTYKLRGDQFPPVYKIQTLLLECYLKENKLDEAENELIQLLTYDVSKSPNYIRFFECYLHYLAAHLYVKKGDLNKSADHFLIFFQKMKMFLCCLKKESIDDIKIQRNRKNSLNEELDIFSKKSQELLNKIYPKIDFRV